MENVEDLLKLSDEYQVKQLIFDPCVKFLEDQPKTKENVMKILALAKLYNLEKVHQGCIDLLKNMRLGSLSETVHLQDLDKEQTQYYLTQRLERLEMVLDQLYPQVFGLVGSLMWLLHDSTKEYVAWCSSHVSGGKFTGSRWSEMRECMGCRGMLNSLVDKTCFMKYGKKKVPGHGLRVHFDNSLFCVLHDLLTVITEN